MQWTSALAVGVEPIDEQHRELMRRLAGLYAAMERQDATEVEKVVAYVAEYVDFHFRAEEAEMEAAGYPGLEVHRRAHAHFVGQFRKHADELARSGPTPFLSAQVSGWLKSWIEAHIGVVDRQFGAFLHRRAGQRRSGTES